MELVSKCNELLTTIPYRQSEKKQLEAVAQQAAADEAYKAQNCKNCPSCGRIVMQNGGCDLMKCGEDYHGGNPPPPPISYLLPLLSPSYL